jgi:hypothetical protein
MDKLAEKNTNNSNNNVVAGSLKVRERERYTYFPQITQAHKEFENKSNFDQLTYLLGEIPQCHHSSKVCDLLPQEKGNQ